MGGMLRDGLGEQFLGASLPHAGPQPWGSGSHLSTSRKARELTSSLHGRLPLLVKVKGPLQKEMMHAPAPRAGQQRVVGAVCVARSRPHTVVYIHARRTVVYLILSISAIKLHRTSVPPGIEFAGSQDGLQLQRAGCYCHDRQERRP
jgi:hypothetical protein